jgi:DNA repair protein RadA/Sms
MAKSSAGAAGYRCTECGWQALKWTGRCGECQAWGTVEEARMPRPARTGIRAVTPRTAAPVSTPAVPIGQVDATDAGAVPTGLDELDRVLGGGLVPGAVLLLAGEPGVGKSTLLLETGALVAEAGRVLYVTGEESAAQVRARADRIGAVSGQLFLAAETDLDAVLGHVDAVEPRLLIIDSVQTIAAADVEGSAGGVTQVRAVANALTAVAKERSMATILVGHVTKDGSVAGPRALEHLVDVVLHFDGDRHSQLRMVRSVKNRYGPTDEVGCFDLGEYGLIGLADPSGLFISQHREPVPGTCVTVTLEGRRPLPAEVQALVGTSVLEVPKRTTSGLDGARVGLVLAVLQRRAGLKIGRQDVYAATVGGVRLTEPSVDLAVAIALASSVSNLSVPHGVVAIGEVGLAGEVRRVAGLSRRLAEAERMGFRRAIVPAGSAGLAAPREGSEVLEVVQVDDIRQALATVLGTGPLALEAEGERAAADLRRPGLGLVAARAGRGGQRAAAGQSDRAVPGEGLRHRDAAGELDGPGGVAAGAVGRVPDDPARRHHDQVQLARAQTEGAGARGGGDRVDVELRVLAGPVAAAAAGQAEHDRAGRAAAAGLGAGRGLRGVVAGFGAGLGFGPGAGSSAGLGLVAGRTGRG